MIALQALWVVVFLMFGKSMVTAARKSLYTCAMISPVEHHTALGSSRSSGQNN
jgi:hypothetical protein